MHFLFDVSREISLAISLLAVAVGLAIIAVLVRRRRYKQTLPELTLAMVAARPGTYEGTLARVREGKYRFVVTHPETDLRWPQGLPPVAWANVGMRDVGRFGMNMQDLKQAARATNGVFFTLGDAERFLDMRPGRR